ncbi:hypothetical protein SLEP1_g28462 [Rubroshorea leprosula]|uniref:Glycosyltransferase n=1 Tax=Rubroshorea leprosula TaxID=152421 RepID=A0AAV5K2F4_9ROSI|nr:hypothetical protein SLEP1_g28462 [Rubroshorea leprosula]
MNHHFLLVCIPAQGHLNPTFRLAKRLILGGARVTLATTIYGLSQIKSFPSLEGLTYASFSDGYDDGNYPRDNSQRYLAEQKRVGSQSLPDLLETLSTQGRPITFIIYSLTQAWVATVARNLSIPSALLFSQSATVFAIFYHCFNSHTGSYDMESKSPPNTITLQGLPIFTWKDLPSLILPNNIYWSFTPSIQEHIQTLEQDPNPCVLINTFDALEEDAIKAVAVADHTNNINLITVGPLIPFDENTPSEKSSSSVDLFETSSDYIQWLNSKPDRSVVYVSFGSLAELQKNQMEEIYQGLIGSSWPFLWVIRSPRDGQEDLADMMKNRVKEEEGLIVAWCSQVEVLNHRSIGCVVGHCGWNSTVESLVAGVPVIAFPQFSDQITNSKMVEEVWRTGVRVKVNEENFVGKEEIKRLVEMVMGEERGEEMRENAKKWRKLALEAIKDGGSSENNLKAFVKSLGS